MGRNHIDREAGQVKSIPIELVERELETRLRQQAALAELGQKIIAISDLKELLDTVVQTVAETLNVDLIKLLELQPGGDKLLLIAGYGWPEGIVGHTYLSASEESQSGYTLISNAPVIVRDLRTETRFHGHQLLSDNGVISGMGVLIKGKDRPYGVLSVHTRESRTFTNDDVIFLQNVANILASAIQRIKAEEVLRLSRNQLSVILGGVMDGITAQDSGGNIIYANSAAAALLGLTRKEDLVSVPLEEVIQNFELYSEDNRPLALDALPGRVALTEKKASTATIRLCNRHTREERWSFVRATPVFNQTGEVELAVNIFQDITEQKKNERAQKLLAETSNLLLTSLEPVSTLRHVADLAVTYLSDWCVISLLQNGEQIRRVAVAHKDPDKIHLAQEMVDEYPPEDTHNTSIGRVLSTGEPDYFSTIHPEDVEALAKDTRHLELMHTLGLKSGMTMPLKVHDRILGTLSLLWAESGHQYDAYDRALAKELAARASLALDNAMLYEEAQALNAELETRVEKRTQQLQTIISRLKTEVSERKRAEEALRQSEALLNQLFASAPDATVLVNSQGFIERINNQTEALFGYTSGELIGQPVDILLPNRFHQKHVLHMQNYLEELKTRTMGAGLELFGLCKDGKEFPVDIMLSPLETRSGSMVIAAVRDITERKNMEAELAEVQRRLIDSIEAERLHLAQEVHDGPMQDLYAITYQVKGLQVEESDPEKREAYESIDEMLHSVLNYLRSISREMRPPTLAPFGLERAIRAHVETLQETRPDLNVALELFPDGKRLDERMRLALFRIYQHAVSNVLRHSEAKNLFIRFRCDPESVFLEIEDDGRGFVLPTRWIELARQGHLGLVGTLERAEAIGGILEIDTQPGKGTRIRVTVPLQSPPV